MNLLDARNAPLSELISELQAPDGQIDGVGRGVGGDFGEFLGQFLMARKCMLARDDARAFEFTLEATKKWASIYEAEDEAEKKWMVGPYVLISTSARQLAMQIDADAGSDKNLKKLVEVMRQIFQKLHKEKAKKAVCVWTCCELLRMYFKLGQVNQCPFLIAALTQPYREGFTLTDLPRPIAVTMSFYWGKHCVFDHKFKDAEEKLSYAFKQVGGEPAPGAGVPHPLQHPPRLAALGRDAQPVPPAPLRGHRARDPPRRRAPLH